MSDEENTPPPSPVPKRSKCLKCRERTALPNGSFCEFCQQWIDDQP